MFIEKCIILDVYYLEDKKIANGAMLFIKDNKIVSEHTLAFEGVEEYVPKEFYKRELKVLIKLMSAIEISEDMLIIIDGYVYVKNDYHPGLGYYLYEHLQRKCPIIGVAKSYLSETELVCKPIHRGNSTRPLYVSAVGMDLSEAAYLIQKMEGEYRIPTFLKRVDELSKLIRRE